MPLATGNSARPAVLHVAYNWLLFNCTKIINLTAVVVVAPKVVWSERKILVAKEKKPKNQQSKCCYL